MVRLLLLVCVLASLVIAALPAPASAATCADFSNQADAQRAANTIDADGDGRYCESLPCPCSTGGGGGSGGGNGGGYPPPKPKKVRPVKRAQHIAARITSVVDGDTIRVKAFGARRRFYTVRLIGIDTPETHKPGRGVECGGRRATAAMWRLSFRGAKDSDGDGLGDSAEGLGRRVTLTTDPTQDTFDRYGRLLAYVKTVAGKNLQVEMLRRGWAKVYVYGGKPFQRVDRFRRASGRAAGGRRGVFRRCGGNFHKLI